MEDVAEGMEVGRWQGSPVVAVVVVVDIGEDEEEGGVRDVFR